jgi:hypothetical protein
MCRLCLRGHFHQNTLNKETSYSYRINCEIRFKLQLLNESTHNTKQTKFNINIYTLSQVSFCLKKAKNKRITKSHLCIISYKENKLMMRFNSGQ